MGKTQRGNGTKLMAVADGSGPPLAVHATFASPHEISPVTDTPLESFVDEFPERMIGHKAYGGASMDEEPATAGIELISPNRGGGNSRDQLWNTHLFHLRPIDPAYNYSYHH